MTEERTGDERVPDLAVGAPFGPGFFLGQLRAFARDRCPNPAEMLPSVELHLATGEVLDLCHVMGLAPGFVVLAVREARGGSGNAGMAMRTELVPYTFITRVTIRPMSATGAPHVGFNPEHAPVFLPQDSSPEAALRAAAVASDAHVSHGRVT
jgi:hypothetical protein